MIQIEASNNINLLNELSQKIFHNNYSKDVGFILYFNEVPIGIASLKIDIDESRLEKIGILEEHRKKGFGDFFTRSIMLRLSEISKIVNVEYYSNYFYQFGFSSENKKTMTILSENIIFPAKCQNK